MLAVFESVGTPSLNFVMNVTANPGINGWFGQKFTFPDTIFLTAECVVGGTNCSGFKIIVSVPGIVQPPATPVSCSCGPFEAEYQFVGVNMGLYGSDVTFTVTLG